MKHFLEKLLQYLFPDHYRCCFCGSEAVLNGLGACSSCAQRLHFCAALPAVSGLDGLYGRYLYDETTAYAIHRLKYGGAQFLAKQLLQGYVLPESLQFDAIAYVPLHKSKQKKRGYNQSELIAKIIADQTSKPIINLLYRSKNTKSQTKLTRQQREQNVSNAFEATKRCDGLRILLVDDVVTTGSTIKECALALKAAGAAKVYGFCLCVHPMLLG